MSAPALERPTARPHADPRASRIATQLEALLRLAAERACNHQLDRSAISSNPRSFERRIAALLSRGSDSAGRAQRLRAWARATPVTLRPTGPIADTDSIEDLVRTGRLSVPIREDLGSLIDEVRLPHLPDLGGSFSTLDLHVDSVTCTSTTRLDRGSDEPLLAIVGLNSDGGAIIADDVILGSIAAGETRAVNRRVLSFPLDDISPFSLFGAVLTLIELDNDDGGSIHDALNDEGFGELIAGAVAVLLLGLSVPILDIPDAIVLIVFVALTAAVTVILELASRNDVIGARRTEFVLPLPFPNPEPSDTHIQLAYSGHGASYKANVRWHLA